MNPVDALGLSATGSGGGRGRRRRVWMTAALSAALVASVSGCGVGGGQRILAGSGGGGSPTAVVYKPSEFKQSSKLSNEWLTMDAAKHRVNVAVTFSSTSLALNGYSHGYAGIDVPKGWTVTVHFKNLNSVLPGGLIVLTSASVNSAKKPAPAFSGATMKHPFKGIGLNQTENFTFKADKVGTYVLESAPSAASGTWLWFIVTVGGKPTVLIKHA